MIVIIDFLLSDIPIVLGDEFSRKTKTKGKIFNNN